MKVDALFETAVGLHQRGDWSEAEKLYRQILAESPHLAVVHYNLGISLQKQQRFDAAVACFREALALKPDLVEAANNLGTCLQSLGNLDEAVSVFRSCLTAKPTFAEAWNNLGFVLKDRGEIDEAIGCMERAVALLPENANLHSNLVYTLHYSPSSTGISLLAGAKLWNTRHAAALTSTAKVPERKPMDGRRIRVGYISAFFRAHGQNLFVVPLLSHHDHDRFMIFCYSDTGAPDAMTENIRSYSDQWRNIAGASDEAVAAVIREDQIDLLIDLNLHSSHHRLLVFARRPAPVQLTWLGYPGTTGMTAIDARLTDPTLDPPGLSDAFYSERCCRELELFWCYDPLLEISVSELPAINNGYVTFGCLNNFCKVNDHVLALWSSILRAVPHSRLLLLAPVGSARKNVVDRLGVASTRIEFVNYSPRPEYLANYRRIDLCLDTYPYNGHTTSLDALWMGVPVVTRFGETAVSRAGLSLLTNLDLSSLAAANSDEFVRIAVDLAHDLPRLNALRETLRERMEKSPLMDAPRFARKMETAFLSCLGEGIS